MKIWTTLIHQLWLVESISLSGKKIQYVVKYIRDWKCSHWYLSTSCCQAVLHKTFSIVNIKSCPLSTSNLLHCLLHQIFSIVFYIKWFWNFSFVAATTSAFLILKELTSLKKDIRVFMRDIMMVRSTCKERRWSRPRWWWRTRWGVPWCLR